MNRRSFIGKATCTGVFLFIPASVLQLSGRIGTNLSPDAGSLGVCDLIPAPDNPDLWAQWRTELHNWRTAMRIELNYNGSSYLAEPLNWVSDNFSCCFIMICDSDFYDPISNKYRIKNLISRGLKEYGGYNSVVLWHAYPRIGLDDRNQFDFYREMPGGLQGVKKVVEEFHDAGIRVFIDYNPWDRGTRRENREDIDLLIEIIGSTNADGLFLDTMKDAPGFREKIDKVRKGIVLEGEIALPLEHIGTHHMSWAQWFTDSRAPGVYRNKWFERHHMQHAIARWDCDKSAQLQTAWMNGSGVLIWENVFGQLLQWNERDKSTIKMMHSIQHIFRDLFSGEEWIPLSEKSEIAGVYASAWGNDKMMVRTLVNRNDDAVEDTLIKIPGDKPMRHFNLQNGEELIKQDYQGFFCLSGKINPRGIGCFLSVIPEKFEGLLKELIEKQKRSHFSQNKDAMIPQLGIGPEKRGKSQAGQRIHEGMISIPSAEITLKMEYRFRESGGYCNIQEHIELAKRNNLHSICSIERKVKINNFLLDETPVTNKMFREFLIETAYKPEVKDNFLKHWAKGEIPAGLENHPVVYVDINDARAYAGWRGSRLPSEEEWQFAAQGYDALEYPWGNTFIEERCNPNLDGKTTDVMAFRSGRSPFGCLDMCGNVWEMTDNIYSDTRTRFIMLKGGSCYRSGGSEWYFDGGPQKNGFIAKMLLIWTGLDRCSTVGFRCAADIQKSVGP